MISSPSETGTPQKQDKRNFIFANVSDQELIKFPGQVNGNPFKLSYLSNCTVWLLDVSATITADNCDNCHFYLGPVYNKVELQDLENCTISVATKEIKCTNSKK